MSGFLEKAGKRLFEKNLEQYAPADPLYEYYTNDKGKQKRRRRALPPGLSARDTKILKSIQKRAHYLDKGFRFCGMRFGWTFIIGIIPVVGDFADVSLNYILVVRKARQAEIPNWLLRRMLLNNLVSASVGFVPLAGDVILAAFKANSRNAALLEEFLRIRGEEYIRIKAEGKDVAEATAGGKGGKGKKVAKGVTKSDAEQVKPGAGRSKGEVVPLEGRSGTVPGGLSTMTGALNSSASTSPTPPSTQNGVNTPLMTGAVSPASPASGTSSGKSRKSGFASWIRGEREKDAKNGSGSGVGQRGRLVEDFGNEDENGAASTQRR